MMKAIDTASAETSLFRGSSRSFGLRAIRTFETVNQRTFDPFNSYHLDIVRGKGCHEATFFRIEKLGHGFKRRTA